MARLPAPARPASPHPPLDDKQPPTTQRPLQPRSTPRSIPSAQASPRPSRPASPHPIPTPSIPPTHESTDVLPVVRDAARALQRALAGEWRRAVRCYVQVPVGLVAILAACFGIDRLLARGGVSFPASVACLVLLFLGLVACDAVLGRRRAESVVRAVNVPGGWALRWMNLFFVQAFVVLPLSPRISFAEIAKMAAVFVVGFVVMMAASAYLTRLIQHWTKSVRRAMPAGSVSVDSVSVDSDSSSSRSSLDAEMVPLRPSFGADADDGPGMPPVPPRSRVAAYITVRGQNLDDPLSSFSDVPAPHAYHHHHHHQSSPRTTRPLTPPTPPTPAAVARADRWAAWTAGHMDALAAGALLVFVGLPVYYATGYGMPLHLAINVLAFFGAMALPASWRQVLHPVIVAAFASLLAIWLLGRVRGDGLADTLHAYKPGTTYVRLWTAAAQNANQSRPLALPGAGDVLSSLLDASIVALALPMFQYRFALRRHGAAIVVPNVALSVVSLFAYPVVCRAVGISATRSLAFTARSLTLALAMPAVVNLGADTNAIAAITILSGVFGVLIGQRLLRLLRIPDDDYVTRGVAMGANASALGTALLLRVDPPAAAISSLAMSLFGTITVAFSSIPPIVAVVRSLVGL